MKVFRIVQHAPDSKPLVAAIVCVLSGISFTFCDSVDIQGIAIRCSVPLELVEDCRACQNSSYAATPLPHLSPHAAETKKERHRQAGIQQCLNCTNLAAHETPALAGDQVDLKALSRRERNT